MQKIGVFLYHPRNRHADEDYEILSEPSNEAFGVTR